MKQYETYLFDLDGTLIDTTELIYQCFRESLKKPCEDFGITIGKEEILQSIGLPLYDQMRSFFERRNIPFEKIDYPKIRREHMEVQKSIYQENIKAFDEVPAVIENLVKNKKRLAVVTSRLIESASVYLKHVGLWKMFEHVVTPESTKHGKPHAEPALKALSLLGVGTENVLFVGDTSHDQRCAKNAGIPFFLVARKNAPLPVEESIEKDCDYCENDLKSLILP